MQMRTSALAEHVSPVMVIPSEEVSDLELEPQPQPLLILEPQPLLIREPQPLLIPEPSIIERLNLLIESSC